MKVVKYEMIDLPEIAIIGKEGLCTKEKNVAQELWQQANSAFRGIADLGMKNTDGSFVGFWGAMSDETLSFCRGLRIPREDCIWQELKCMRMQLLRPDG